MDSTFPTDCPTFTQRAPFCPLLFVYLRRSRAPQFLFPPAGGSTNPEMYDLIPEADKKGGAFSLHVEAVFCRETCDVLSVITFKFQTGVCKGQRKSQQESSETSYVACVRTEDDDGS